MLTVILKKTVLPCAFAAILALVALTVVVAPLLPAGASKTTLYYDLACGRQRTVQTVLWFPVRDKIKETPLSREYRRLLGAPGKPVWEFTSSRSLSGLCDCNTGSAWGLGKTLELAFEMGSFTDDAKKRVILTFFGSVRSESDRASVSRYISRLSDAALERSDKGLPVTAKDLPAAPVLP